MQEITHEDYNYLNEFKTLEELKKHKFEKIKELMIKRSEISNKIRKLRLKTVISNIELKQYGYLEEQERRCSNLLEHFTHIDQVYMQYFRERC